MMPKTRPNRPSIEDEHSSDEASSASWATQQGEEQENTTTSPPPHPLHALRGHAALSGDETAGSNLEREHLSIIPDPPRGHLAHIPDELVTTHFALNRGPANVADREAIDPKPYHMDMGSASATKSPEQSTFPFPPTFREDYLKGTSEKEPRRDHARRPSPGNPIDVPKRRQRPAPAPTPLSPPEFSSSPSVYMYSEANIPYFTTMPSPYPYGLTEQHTMVSQDYQRGGMPLVPKSPRHFNVQEMINELEFLREENDRLKNAGPSPRPHFSQPAVPAHNSRTFYKLGETYYLDEPHWEPGDGAPSLLATNPIRNIGHFVDQHPEIAFIICKEYNVTPPANRDDIETKDGVYRTPEPVHEFISVEAPDMLEAIADLVKEVPGFGHHFPHFDPNMHIAAPYLFMYYSLPYMDAVLPELSITSRRLIELLRNVVLKSHQYEYEAAKSRLQQGMIARHLMKYLICPGDVLIDNDPNVPRAMLALGWIEHLRETTVADPQVDNIETQRNLPARYGPLANTIAQKKAKIYNWSVPVWYWSFNGVFEKTVRDLTITMKVSYEDEAIPITSLDVFPLKFAGKEKRDLLERRGKTFWSLRNRLFVSYLDTEGEESNNVDDRYMIDMETYKKLHPKSDVARLKLRSDISQADMTRDEPPLGDSLLLFPPNIVGHNLHRKVWVDLVVDRIRPVTWNKQAFKNLVADEEAKELVHALVTKQLAISQATDFIAGKGNGLIMLLHGGPVTGKTFTAEGVAEFAEKPLLRVTCGDVGTHAEIVEERLSSSLHLGKMWDCVVLLDEADIFLEERDTMDLNRNALVSVFLRALEYYEGILILTSNRVGTFDEAFKSRIQLALHYENLGPSQRRKIWRNFMNHIKLLESTISTALPSDIEDVLDHIDDLAKETMNGREIRNAITLARQLASARNEPFRYSHLQHVMRVGSNFGKYLQDLRMGLTDDEIKADAGLRLTYKSETAKKKN